MVRIQDLHIIKILTIVFFLCFIISCTWKNECIKNGINKTSLSVINEQKYWNDWISVNDGSTCPLAPFVLRYTKSEITQIDNLIHSIGELDNSILFITVNIDNGVYQIYYYAWGEAENSINFVKWDGPNTKILTGQQFADIFFFKKARKILKNSVTLVDLKRRNVLDGDSVYISLFHKGQISRFAAYDPEIKTIANKDFPFLYIEYLQLFINEK